MTYVIVTVLILVLLALLVGLARLIDRFFAMDDDQLIDMDSPSVAATCTCRSLNSDWGAGSGFHEANTERDPHCQIHGDGRA